MNKTMYGIRRKGENQPVTTSESMGEGFTVNLELCSTNFDGYETYLTPDVNEAKAVLADGQNHKYYGCPRHNLNPEDYEVVTIETVIKAV